MPRMKLGRVLVCFRSSGVLSESFDRQMTRVQWVVDFGAHRVHLAWQTAKVVKLETKGNIVVTNILLVVSWLCLTAPLRVLDAPPTSFPGHRECVVSGTTSILGHLSVQTQLQILQAKIEDPALYKVCFTTVCRLSRRHI